MSSYENSGFKILVINEPNDDTKEASCRLPRNFAEHYTEVILNTLIKVGYYKPTNQRKDELRYCWWKGLPLSGVYETYS